MWQRLTVADSLAGLIGLAAGLIRFIDLGKMPLSPNEAAQALPVWQMWQPGGASGVVSPAYFSLSSLLLPLLGDSDTVARLIPVLFGLGIVLLPWLLRRQLGTIGTLTASLLLAVSPIQAIVSRTAGGEGLALFAILFMLAASLWYDSSRSARWFMAVFAGLALGLTSSPLFYGGLVTMLLATRSDWRGRLTEISPVLWRKTIITSFTLFIALSTMVLWYLPGAGAAALLPATWLTQFGIDPALMFEPLLAFMRYEPFLTVMGLTAVLWAIRSNNQLARQMAGWMSAAFILLLLQPGQMGNAALLTLPAALLVGLMANGLLEKSPNRWGWGWAGGALLLGSLILVNLARFSRTVTAAPQEFGSAWIVLMAVTTGLVTIYFLLTWEAGTAVAQGTFLAFLTLAVFYQWGTGWWLSHEAANDPRERWVTQATDDDVRLLVTALQDISRQSGNANAEIDLFSSVDSPVLRWYLRDFEQLQFGQALPLNAQNEAIISPDEATLALGSDYAGADFGLLRDGLLPPEIPSQNPGLDLLHWWLFHESSLAANEERVILWWRTNLVD